LTVVGALAVLFEALGSPVVEETVAVLVMLGAAPAPGFTTIVTVTSLGAPAFTVPALQVTVAVPEHVPWLAAAETNVTLEGSVSETVTPLAGLGPALWTVRVYVRLSPTWTGSGASVFVSWRSAEGVTVVGTLAVLFDETGSAVVAETDAVLVTLGTALWPAVATIVTVTSLGAPALTVPRSQLTVALPEQEPFVEEAETSVSPAGSASETVTAAAGLGPALWTVSV
jgi:hypothetical protein